MRNIEVPTDTATKFELGDTAADIQRKRGGREQREREREEETAEGGVGGARMEETTHSVDEGVAEKCPRTERSDTEMDTEELYDKTNKHFKERARKECTGRFAHGHKAVCQSVQDLVQIPKDSL